MVCHKEPTLATSLTRNSVSVMSSVCTAPSSAAARTCPGAVEGARAVLAEHRVERRERAHLLRRLRVLFRQPVQSLVRHL